MSGGDAAASRCATGRHHRRRRVLRQLLRPATASRAIGRAPFGAGDRRRRPRRRCAVVRDDCGRGLRDVDADEIRRRGLASVLRRIPRREPQIDPAWAANDAIVPSPLMPHLMAEWLVERARRRWPTGRWYAPLAGEPAVPWQRAGCRRHALRELRGPGRARSTASSRASVRTRAARVRGACRSRSRTTRARDATQVGKLNAAVLFCRHRAYGVGMFDTRRGTRGRRLDRVDAANDAAEFVIGTVSHCHGALTRLVVSSPRAEAHSQVR